MVTKHSSPSPASSFPDSIATRCPVVHCRILFFIRMPKCASTSFTSLVQKSAKSLGFHLHFDPSGAYDWDNSTIRKEVALVKEKSRRGKILYARHFYFIDFRTYGLTNFTYVTVIRHPTARFVSSYLYYHFSSKPYIQKMLDPKHKNESLLQCISQRHNGCAHNWMTKYFCGHARACRDGNEAALIMAKSNMRNGFAAVGLVEDTELTLKVFARIVPEYFSRGHMLPKANKNERLTNLSPEEEKAVRNANLADIELYEYAKELLWANARSCQIPY